MDYTQETGLEIMHYKIMDSGGEEVALFTPDYEEMLAINKVCRDAGLPVGVFDLFSLMVYARRPEAFEPGFVDPASEELLASLAKTLPAAD